MPIIDSSWKPRLRGCFDTLPFLYLKILRNILYNVHVYYICIFGNKILKKKRHLKREIHILFQCFFSSPEFKWNDKIKNKWKKTFIIVKASVWKYKLNTIPGHRWLCYSNISLLSLTTCFWILYSILYLR